MALVKDDMAKERLNEAPTSEDFSIDKLFFCTWHGNMGNQPGRLVDVTLAIPDPNEHNPRGLIELAQKATADMLSSGNANESYRASKSKISTFTITTPNSSAPLATFRVPINLRSDVPITFSPSANTTGAPKPTMYLKKTSWGQLRTGCNYAFNIHGETFAWVFASGTEMILRDANARVLAKFYHAPSWFQSGGVLAIGEDGKRRVTAVGNDQPRQQLQQDPEWEHVVVVTLFAFLRREREWRYTIAGFLFPIKRGGSVKKEPAK